MTDKSRTGRRDSAAVRESCEVRVHPRVPVVIRSVPCSVDLGDKLEDYAWLRKRPGAGTGVEHTEFPGGRDFDGNRWKNLHYTYATKRVAHSQRAGKEGSPS